MLEAIKFAHDICRQVIELQNEFHAKVQPVKVPFVAPDETELMSKLRVVTMIGSRKRSKSKASKLAMMLPTR